MQYTIAVVVMFTLFIPSTATALQKNPIIGQERNTPVQQIVIHATGGPDCTAQRSFRSGTLNGIVQHFIHNQHRISIHYIIDRTGDTVNMVAENQIAHHVRGHNSNSIGIELINDGDGNDQFPAPQITALIALLRDLLPRYQLTFANIKSHAELDDSWLNCGSKRMKRKPDPGAAFPWEQLKQEFTAPPVIIPPPLPTPPPVITPAPLPPAPNPAVQLVQRQKQINALTEIDRQFKRQEREVNNKMNAVFNDQRDAEKALQWRSSDEDRAAQIQETLEQLKRREMELRLELTGAHQVQENAQAAIRKLRNLP
jgi:N-acetylmuramoyl-L-alanine amidase